MFFKINSQNKEKVNHPNKCTIIEQFNYKIDVIDKLLVLRGKLADDYEAYTKITHLINCIIELMIIDTKPVLVKISSKFEG